MILLGFYPSIFTLALYLILCAVGLHFNKDEESRRGVLFLLALLILDIFLNLFFRGFSLSERVFLLLQAISVASTLYLVLKSSFAEPIPSEVIFAEEEIEELFIPASISKKVEDVINSDVNSILIKGDYGSGRSALARHIGRGKDFKIKEDIEEYLDELDKIIATSKPDYKFSEAFSSVIEIPSLGAEDRVACFKFFLKSYSQKIDWKGVAELTEGRVLRDIKKTCFDALDHMKKRNGEIVEPQDLAIALETLLKRPA